MNHSRQLLRRTVILPASVLFLFAAIVAGCSMLMNLVVHSIALPYIERIVPGLDISLTSVRSDLVSKIDFRGVAFRHRLDDGTLFEAKLPRIQVDFSLLDLMDGFSSLMSNASITADIEDAGVTVASSDANAPTAVTLPLPAPPFPFPAIILRFDRLFVSYSESTILLKSGELRTANSSAMQQSSQLPFTFKAGSFEMSLGKYRKRFGELQAACFYQQGLVGITQLGVAGKEFAHAVLLKSDEGKASLQAALSLWGGVIELHSEIDEEVRVTFTTSGVNLDQVALPFSDESIPKTGILEGHGKVVIPIAAPQQMTGEVSLSLGATTFLSQPIDTFDLQAKADEGLLHIAKMHAESQKSFAELNDIELPLDALLSANWPELASKGLGLFSLSSANFVTDSKLFPKGFADFAARNGIDLFQIQGSYEKGTLVVPRLAIHSKNDSFSARDIIGDLHPWLLENDWKEVALTGDAQLETVGAAFVRDLVDDFPFLEGKFNGTAHLDGKLGSPEVSFTVSGEQVTLDYLTFDQIAVSGTYQRQQYTLDTINASNGSDTLQGFLKYQVAAPNDYHLGLDFKVAELRDYMSDEMRQRLQLHGELAGKFSLHSEGDNKRTGNFSGNSLRLVYSNTKAENLKIDADLSGNTLTIRSLEGRLPEQDLFASAAGDISFNSQWDQFQISLKKFSMTRQQSKFVLDHPAELQYVAGKTIFETPFILQHQSGIFTLGGTLSDNGVDLSLSGNIESGAHFFESFGLSDFSFQKAIFTAALTQTLDNPHISFSGRITGMSAGEALPLDGEIQCSFADEKVQIDQLILRDAVSPRLQLQGQVPFALSERGMKFPEGPLKVAGRIDLQASPFLPWLFHKELDRIGRVQGTIDLGGTWQEPIGTLQLEVEDLLLKARPDWLPAYPIAFHLAVKAEKKKITLEKATVESEIASVQVHGSVTGQDFFERDFLRSGKEKFTQAEMDLQGVIVFKEIDWLASRYEMLRRISGKAEAQFQLSGAVGNPHLDAAISLEEGEMRLSNDLPPLQEVSLQAELADSSVEITQFSASLGGAPLQSQGRITFSLEDKNVVFDLMVSGKELLFYRADGITFRGDASLRISGPFDHPQIDGDIVLTDARVTRNIDFVSSLLSGFTARETPAPHFPAFTDPPLRDALFNLTLTSQSPVVLANNMLRGIITPYLALHGTGEVPFLSGKLYINEANLVLPAGKIKMDSGLVQFLATDPDRPVLELNGSAKMLGYDIVIGISGPYDEPVITLSSTPSLANEELLMLLLAGKRPTAERNQQNQSKNFSSVAVYVGENLLKSIWPNGHREQDTTILDRLQLEVGRNITQQGEETIEAQFIVAENLKQGQNALLLTGEKDVWDKYNGGLRLVFKFK